MYDTYVRPEKLQITLILVLILLCEVCYLVLSMFT